MRYALARKRRKEGEIQERFSVRFGGHAMTLF